MHNLLDHRCGIGRVDTVSLSTENKYTSFYYKRMPNINRNASETPFVITEVGLALLMRDAGQLNQADQCVRMILHEGWNFGHDADVRQVRNCGEIVKVLLEYCKQRPLDPIARLVQNELNSDPVQCVRHVIDTKAIACMQGSVVPLEAAKRLMCAQIGSTTTMTKVLDLIGKGTQVDKLYRALWDLHRSAMLHKDKKHYAYICRHLRRLLEDSNNTFVSIKP